MILKILQYLQQHKTNILLNVNYDIFKYFFFFHVHNLLTFSYLKNLHFYNTYSFKGYRISKICLYLRSIKNYPEKLCTHYHYICMTGQLKNMNHRPITIVKINKHSLFFKSPMSIVQM